MEWSEIPFFRVSICLIVGIFVFEYFHIPYIYAVYPLICSAILYGLFSVFTSIRYTHPNWFGLIFLSIFIFLGGSILHLKQHIDTKSLIETKEANQEINAIGVVQQELKSGTKLKYVCSIHQYSSDSQMTYQLHRSDVILTFDTSDVLADKYVEGDLISFRTALRPIRSTTNPECFDYATYLRYQGINQQGYIKPNKHRLIESNAQFFIFNWANEARAFFRSTLEKYIDDPKLLGISEAILIGERLMLTEDTYTSFANTGAIHILAVSGFHVGVFILVFKFFLGLVKRKDTFWKVLKVAILVSIVLFYVIMTGMSPSVVRAGIMVIIYIIGAHMDRHVNFYNFISVAAVIMLLYDPYLLFQASFQFSYISLLSILYFQPKISLLYIPKTWIGKQIWGMTNVSISAQIFVAPLTTYYFHQFPMYFILSGIIAVTIAIGILYLGLALVIMEIVFPKVNNLVGSFLKLLLNILDQSIHMIDRLPFSVWKGLWISDNVLFLFLFLFLVLIVWLETRRIHFWIGTLAICILVSGTLCWESYSRTQTNEIVMYDMYGGTLVDIVENGKLRTFQSEIFTDKTIKFTSLNYRLKNHVVGSQINEISNLFCFDGMLFYVFNGKEDFDRLSKLTKPDVLIVTNSMYNGPANILSKISPSLIILDKNIKPWIRSKWQTYQDTYAFSMYDIKSQGAFCSYKFFKK